MIPDHKGEIPALVLILPFLSGICLKNNKLFLINNTIAVLLFISVCVLFIILNFNYKRFQLHKYRWIGGFLITLILFLFGWLITLNYNELDKYNHFSKIKGQYLVVNINNEPVLKNGLLRFTTHTEFIKNDAQTTAVSGTLLVTLKDTAAKNLYYGDELLLPAKYSAVVPPVNTAEFNYKQYLANKNIFYQAYLYPGQYVVLGHDTGNPIIAWSLKLRRSLVQKLKLNIKDTAAAAVASTLLLGYKADLSNDVMQAYSKTGTVHVLVVSGAHIAIIYLLLTFVLQFLNRFKYGKFFKAAIIIMVIGYYALLTGLSPAVCRAAFMISLVITGKAFRRYINTLNLLAVSAFLLLIYDPFFINDVGFQLSYLAITGLLLFQPMVYKLIKFKNKWASKIWALCSVSIAAQLVTFPLSAFYFHQVPVYALISNLFVIIPLSIILYTGIVYLVMPQLPLISKSLAFIIENTIRLMNKVLAIIEHAPFAGISRIWLTTPEYLLWYVIIICLFCFLHYKKLWPLQLGLICLLLLSISFSVKSLAGSGTKTITWLDLKKHQGIIFKNGDDGIVLSDLKNNDKNYLYSIQPYLDSARIYNVKLYNFNQEINTSWLRKKYGLIRFLNTTVFILDDHWKTNPVDKKLTADYIYITGNPANARATANTNFSYKNVIIDGSNSDRSINEWRNQLATEKINYKVLKRNNSVVSVSN